MNLYRYISPNCNLLLAEINIGRHDVKGSSIDNYWLADCYKDCYKNCLRKTCPVRRSNLGESSIIAAIPLRFKVYSFFLIEASARFQYFCHCLNSISMMVLIWLVRAGIY